MSTRCRRRDASRVDIGALGADLLTLSAHKIGGVKGVGALVRAREDIHFPEPLIRGGGQERGLRAGTENVAGIAAFGAAAKVALHARAEEAAQMLALRDALEDGIREHRPAGGDFRRGRRTAAEHDPVRGPRHEGRNRHYRFRPRGDCGVVGRRLLVRQGATLACACGHGGFAAAHARRHPRQFGLFDHENRRRKVPKCLEKALRCII